jgi:hypothetical protein
MPGVNLEDASAVALWQLQHPGKIILPRGGQDGTAGGYQNAAALAAATSGASAAQRAAQLAAQQALADARDRFSLDQMTKAPQATLLRDISTILKDMKVTGASQVSIDLEHARDLAAINQNTKTTATQRAALTLSLLPGGTYARPDQAGYGSTIASFGIQQRDHVAEMVAILRQELAASQRRERHDEEVIATMQATLREQRTGTQAATLTAGNTTRLVAMGATAPAPYRDPRARVGAVHP